VVCASNFKREHSTELGRIKQQQHCCILIILLHRYCKPCSLCITNLWSSGLLSEF